MFVAEVSSCWTGKKAITSLIFCSTTTIICREAVFHASTVFPPERQAAIFCVAFLSIILLAVTPLGVSPAHAQAITHSPDAQTHSQDAIIYGPGKLNVVPSAAWLQAKNEHRIVVRNGHVTILSSSPNINYPQSYLLSYNVSGQTYEPRPTSTDAAGNYYDDGYYGNFCAAGAKHCCDELLVGCKSVYNQWTSTFHRTSKIAR